VESCEEGVGVGKDREKVRKKREEKRPVGCPQAEGGEKRPGEFFTKKNRKQKGFFEWRAAGTRKRGRGDVLPKEKEKEIPAIKSGGGGRHVVGRQWAEKAWVESGTEEAQRERGDRKEE